MTEFEPHDYFHADDQGYISRQVFIEKVRGSYDHMRELATYIKGYDEKIDEYLQRWDQNLESLDDSIIGLLHEWIDDSTFATVINEEIFKTKADQVELEKVTAQLTQKAQQSDLNIEKERIDTLITLPEGSTTNDARLEDITVGYDGTVYDSPGEAVRQQFGAYMTEENESWVI